MARCSQRERWFKSVSPMTDGMLGIHQVADAASVAWKTSSDPALRGNVKVCTSTLEMASPAQHYANLLGQLASRCSDPLSVPFLFSRWNVFYSLCTHIYLQFGSTFYISSSLGGCLDESSLSKSLTVPVARRACSNGLASICSVVWRAWNMFAQPAAGGEFPSWGIMITTTVVVVIVTPLALHWSISSLGE